MQVRLANICEDIDPVSLKIDGVIWSYHRNPNYRLSRFGVMQADRFALNLLCLSVFDLMNISFIFEIICTPF